MRRFSIGGMGGVVLGLRFDCDSFSSWVVVCGFAYCFAVVSLILMCCTLCIKGTDRLGAKAQPILVLLLRTLAHL